MREWGKMSMGEPKEEKPIKVIHQVMSHWKSGKYQHAKMLKYMCFCKIMLLAEIHPATGRALNGWCLVEVVYTLINNPEWISKYIF
jgi:hypothetical protein